MRRVFMALLTGALCLGAPETSPAGQITLRVESSSAFRDGKIFVSVKVTNHGTDPAYSVQPEALCGTNAVRGEIAAVLDVNASSRFTLDLGAPPSPDGEYAIILKTRYTDCNGFPSTTLDCLPVFTAEPSSLRKPLVARLSPRVFYREGKVSLSLENTSAQPITAAVRLVLPDEIECAGAHTTLTVPPQAISVTAFPLSNRSALAGSSYAILAVIDYADGAQPRTLSAFGRIVIRLPGRAVFQDRKPWNAGIIALMILFAALQFLPAGKPLSRIPPSVLRAGDVVFDTAVLGFLLVFTLSHLAPTWLVADTLTTGGDTPAHNYLASHLKDQLFHHGRVVSWAGGWWCGFPMFQYYFCLPYLLTALLSLVIPFNIAFKFVSVLGILLLPAAAYAAGRLFRLPRPGPLLLAIAMVPFLFIHSHTMWGANIYSTLSGMIANSLGFPIMLVFIASSWRDADDGVFRLRTVFLLAALLASHFFTSLIGGLAAALLPFLRPRAGFRRAAITLAKEYALTFLLMAWWLIPLLAKQAFAMDCGTNWKVSLPATLPEAWRWPLAAMAVGALGLGILLRDRFTAVMAWMLAGSLALFFWGYDHVSPVFVNIRLWPFAFFALLALAAGFLGFVLSRSRAAALAVSALLAAVLTRGIDTPNDVPTWAEWNYSGAETKPRWAVFEELVKPLDNSPGRLANDLYDQNHVLGSVRAFEAVPHLVRKPILEGGIVNSAAGSMYAYYLQGEFSTNSAGYPTIVTPSTFNITNATRHAELFNVKHFIAKWPGVRRALAEAPDWKRLRSLQGWDLYELTTHDGRMVCLPRVFPEAVRTAGREGWKKAGLDWIYAIRAVDQPFVLLRPGEPAGRFGDRVISPDVYREHVLLLRGTQPGIIPPRALPAGDYRITDEEVADDVIRFRTNAIGLPHLIKCTYFPNWKVRGASQVFMVTPCFMLVFPEREQVELYYGSTLSDTVGRLLTAAGTALLAGVILFRVRRRLAIKGTAAGTLAS